MKQVRRRNRVASSGAAVSWVVLWLVAGAAACASGGSTGAHRAGVQEESAVVLRGRGLRADRQADSDPGYWHDETGRVDLPGPSAQSVVISGSVGGDDDRRRAGGAELAQHSVTPGDEPLPPDLAEPILIYTATLFLGVYQVEESQRRVEEIASELGGFLHSLNDDTIVVRVPAARFDDALDLLEALGDVLHRIINVQDISEEFHDLTLRLETMRSMRARLEELLDQAENVAEALQIERELQRLTLEIETMEGRLRFLSDRVAFSTITVNFQPNVPNVQQPLVQLPFPWVSQLGLNNLLNLW